MSTLVKERKHDQVEKKSSPISTNQLPIVSLTHDDRAFWIDSVPELKPKTTTNTQTSSFRMSQKVKKSRLLTAEEKTALREKIIDSYEKINFYTSDAENAKHYETIESYMKTLSASNYSNSKKKKQSKNIVTTYILLDSIKNKLTQLCDLLSGTKTHHQTWEFEDDIISRCLYVVYLMLDQKANRFSDDEELMAIGRNTFLHNAIRSINSPPQEISRFYPSTENQERHNNSFNGSQDKLKSILQFCYYTKTKEEKLNFQKDMLAWYIESLENATHDKQIIKPMQQFLLKDFRGDFAVIVKEKRKEKNLTQKLLADTAGLERSMIAKIEGMQASTSLEATINVLTALDLGLMIYPLDLQDTISSCSSSSEIDKDK